MVYKPENGAKGGYAFLLQFSLSKELITAEIFGHWLELLVAVIERPVPPEVDSYDDKEETIYWRCKKWALKIIDRVFEKSVFYLHFYLHRRSTFI